MINKIAKALISRQIQRYATVQSLEISNGFREIRIVVLLKGDHSPIEIDLLEIVFAENKIYPSQVRANKEWITNLLMDHIDRLVIKVPKEFVRIFKGKKDER